LLQEGKALGTLVVHTLPQAPQLKRSLLRSVQMEPQFVEPAWQEQQLPLLHTSLQDP
jgi:hypothetical protein